jgi:hypothetical protein
VLDEAVPTVAAIDPKLSGAIVAGHVVFEPIGAVVAQPRLTVERAEQRVSIANVFELAVVGADGFEQRLDLVPIGSVAGQRLRACVQRGAFVGS